MAVVDSIIFLLVFFGPGVVLFFAERVLIRVTRQLFRPLRFLPLLTLLIPLGLAVQEWQTGGWFWELGFLLYLVMAGLMLVGWALAWIGAVKKYKDTE